MEHVRPPLWGKSAPGTNLPDGKGADLPQHRHIFSMSWQLPLLPDRAKALLPSDTFDRQVLLTAAHVWLIPFTSSETRSKPIFNRFIFNDQNLFLALTSPVCNPYTPDLRCKKAGYQVTWPFGQNHWKLIRLKIKAHGPTLPGDRLAPISRRLNQGENNSMKSVWREYRQSPQQPVTVSELTRAWHCSKGSSLCFLVLLHAVHRQGTPHVCLCQDGGHKQALFYVIVLIYLCVF